MNFFEKQDRARRRTGLLLFLYAVAVALIVAAVTGASTFFISTQADFPNGVPNDVVGWIAAVTLAIIAIGTASGIVRFGGGGAAVAERLGAERISPATQNPDERKLLNVVEEMAIASGIAVPTTFVFKGGSINAFAAGTDPGSAVVAVSQGALTRLSRDELQGVVAHEFSHIFNGDMRLNMRLIGVLHGILAIALVGRGLMRTRGRKNPLPLLGLILFILGYIGVFMSRLIKSAVSRQRELLADASAVQFTRNPGGLAGALYRIQDAGSVVNSEKAEELSHLFFAQSFLTAFDNLFATHPPLPERLRAIDPFGRYRPSAEKPTPPPEPKRPTAPRAASPIPVAAAVVTAAAVTASVGNPSTRDIATAADFRAAIPEELSARLTSEEAPRVIYGLLLSGNEAIRERQVALLPSNDDARTALDTVRAIQTASLRARLPLIEIAAPALRALASEEKKRVLETARRLIRADNRVQPFEFAVECLLSKILLGRDDAAAVGSAPADAACLLSYLAYTGAPGDETRAAKAFAAGAKELEFMGKKAILTWDSCGPEEARRALAGLDHLKPAAKERLMAALSACVLADAKVTPDEWEIVRALGACLECPVPLLPPEPDAGA